MSEGEIQFSKHQIDLLTGDAQAATPEEDKFIHDNANTIIRNQIGRESRLDQLRKIAHKAAEKFEEAGRPMGGAKDD